LIWDLNLKLCASSTTFVLTDKRWCFLPPSRVSYIISVIFFFSLFSYEFQ
jgi:hypothetical protein